MASPSGQQNQAQDDQVLQYVTFRLDDETYGIDVMQIQEVLRYTEIAPVPGAPDYVLGIINQGVCNKNGELIILVEFDKMLSDHEWAEISSL